jgi:hypothetical protein
LYLYGRIITSWEIVFLGTEIPHMEVKLIEVIRGAKFECYLGEEVM